MYDTFNIKIYSTYPHYNRIVNRLKSKYDYRTDKRHNEEIYVLQIDNYSIHIRDHFISLKGSLCKFYLGNNQETLTRAQTREAIKRLENCLGCDLSDAVVTRVDFGANFIVEHKTRAYLDSLEYLSLYKRNAKQRGVYFNQETKVLAFYDKVAQVNKDTPGYLLPVFVNKNVLRYEFRFIKKIATTLKLKDRTVKSVVSDEGMDRACKIWLSSYLNIIRTKELIPLELFNDKRRLNDFLLQSAILNFGGLPAILKLIRIARDIGVIRNDNQMSTIRRFLKALFSPSDTLKEISVAQELKNHIVHTAKSFLKSN